MKKPNQSGKFVVWKGGKYVFVDDPLDMSAWEWVAFIVMYVGMAFALPALVYFGGTYF
jgi:hypothetical protein